MKLLRTLLFHDVYRVHPEESGFTDPGARRYKLALPDFERQLAGLATVHDETPLFLARDHFDDPPAPRHAITVDDGGLSFHSEVAGRLEDRGWRGHCFMTTGYVARPGFLDKTQLRELHARGHVIGSHSVSHPRRFAALPWNEMLREWEESRKTLEDILGAAVTSASVPGGHFSTEVAQAASAAGITALFTSEPVTRIRQVGNCAVFGRYSVRAASPPDFAARVIRGARLLRGREWLAWNGKKALKAALGGGYSRIADWAGSESRASPRQQS